MVTFREFFNALRQLGIDRSLPVIAHASLSAFGEVHGGADSVLGALLGSYNTIMMPAFTYKTMIVPEIGPEDNALHYGSGVTANRLAEFFTPDMPADRLIGAVAEALRHRPAAQRSSHPILSFSGVNAQAALDAQTLDEPFAPIHAMHLDGGWVLLLGVNHTVNTSIHYAERLADRRQFIRWALTQRGVVECPGFPGCSEGFQSLAPHLVEVTRSVLVGQALVTAVPLREMVTKVRYLIAQDPLALLCSRSDCERCQAVRASVAVRE